MILPNVALPWEMAHEPRGMLRLLYVDEQVARLAMEVGTEAVDYRYSYHACSVISQPCHGVFAHTRLGQNIVVCDPSVLLTSLSRH